MNLKRIFGVLDEISNPKYDVDHASGAHAEFLKKSGYKHEKTDKTPTSFGSVTHVSYYHHPGEMTDQHKAALHQHIRAHAPHMMRRGFSQTTRNDYYRDRSAAHQIHMIDRGIDHNDKSLGHEIRFTRYPLKGDPK